MITPSLAVYTQPDKPAGRGKVLTSVPVAQWAAAHSLPIYQPRSFRKDPTAIDQLRALQPDVIVVAAYGLILPQAVLDVPRFGCVNVHGSILPRHRGAAPITSAILAGDAETGITIMQMDAGMDTGPMLSVGREPIRSDDTTASLSERLSQLGAQLLIDTLPRYLNGEITPQPQPDEGVTYCPKINKADAQIDWTQARPSRSIAWCARTFRGRARLRGGMGRLVKILKVRDQRISEQAIRESARNGDSIGRWRDRGGDGRRRARTDRDSTGRAQGDEARETSCADNRSLINAQFTMHNALVPITHHALRNTEASHETTRQENRVSAGRRF